MENSRDIVQKHYDAIVIGTGITGGWAAKELCEGGLKTLVLERGRMVRHREDYPTMNMDPWTFQTIMNCPGKRNSSILNKAVLAGHLKKM